MIVSILQKAQYLCGTIKASFTGMHSKQRQETHLPDR